MQVFHLVKGNRLPSIEIKCFDANGTVDFTGCTAVFYMEATNGTTLVNGTAAVVSSASGGRLRYDWGATDTTTAGRHRAWFTVTKGGLTWSFPNRGRDGNLLVDIAEST